MTVRLYRLGTDPEFLFSRIAEWEHHVVPAPNIIGKNKVLTTQSFIGTDNHPATAELRPPPTHNVWYQLAILGEALHTVDRYLRDSKTHSDVQLVASPYIGGEPLGGHIHVSFFNDDKQFKSFLDKGWTYTSGWTGAATDPNDTDFEGAAARSVVDKAFVRAIPTPIVFVEVLDYLLLPLETWLQPWAGRTHRNSKYGSAKDDLDRAVRWINASTKPHMPKFKDWSYLHYEYRVPSSWLSHPGLAYLYLGLAKLSILNWDLIVSKLTGARFTNNSPIYKLAGGAPRNALAKEIFMERFKELVPHLRFSADCRGIPGMLEHSLNYRDQWVNPFTPINVEAWRRLL